MVSKTIYGKLLAKREGEYSNYVIRSLDDYELYIFTRLPNWQTPEINIGDIGYFQIDFVFAGDTYFNKMTGSSSIYQYSNIYFVNFINESISNTDKIII